MKDDGMLSQDEIDALLNGTDEEDQNDDNTPSTEQYLSSLEIDALGEIGNISFGSSATTLSMILNQKVEITTPTIHTINKNDLEKEFPVPYVGIEVRYTEGFTGTNLFVLESKDAAVIADLMLGGEGKPASTELNDIHLSAVQEAMNQMMGTSATSMSTIFNKKVDITPPFTSIMDVANEEAPSLNPDDNLLIKVSFQLKVGTLIDSVIMQLLPVTFAKELVNELLNPAQEPMMEETEPPTAEKSATEPESAPAVEEEISSEVTVTNEMPQQDKAAVKHPRQMGAQQNDPASQVQSAAFSNFEGESTPSPEQRNLDLLMDIPLKVTVELGRTKRSVREILELTSGSIIELDKLAGEPVDILVNQKLIAKGEVVVIDENFGVRVTEIVNKEDRLKQLK
ncbi:flagellar motor switch phosphatase FliY [Gracilibacillus phocaeensis]|uniref:flagellar motor switch phosphatase FliY n=1 Tax=Gracilibacillus phocaeensis TaxID=2042304 RepID=UPI001032341E|nr:flagellar motor switch phosphatase FliY [Gracilibacillus phocaeensis]